MDKIQRRVRRCKSIKKKITGTSERPRMRIHKSNKNLVVQIIDDFETRTICGLSTSSKEIKEQLKANTTRKNVKFAELLGQEISKKALEKGIKKVAFDRAGYKYHGVVKAIADSARKNGLEF